METSKPAEQPGTGETLLRGRARDWQSRLLLRLRDTANVRSSCDAAGIGRATYYRERQRNPAFAEAADAAIRDAVELVYAEAWRRAVNGVEVPVFWDGKVVGTITRYSDRLLEKLLYANAHHLEANGANFHLRPQPERRPTAPAKSHEEIAETVRKYGTLISARRSSAE